MAKLLDGNTVVTIQNEKFGTTVFESHDVTLSSLNKGLSYSLVVNSAVQSSEWGAVGSKEPQKPSAEDKKELLRQQHADTIVGVLKGAEESLIQAQMLRAKLEAEAELRKLESRGKIMKAVHDAIQAGLDMEELTKDMRDDYAGYVSDMAEQVYINTDLDSLVNEC